MSEVPMNFMNEEVVLEQPGFLKRILWTVTSPGKLMENLAQRPRVLFGLILSALSLDVLYLARLPLYKDFLRSTTLASSEYVESLTGQAMTAEMVEEALPTSMITGLISQPFGALFGLLLITLIFFAIFKIMGGQGKFKAYLSVTAYSGVISALYILLILIVSFFTGSLHQDVPLTSLATLASSDMAGTFFYGVLKGLEIFSIWSYAVMAIGFTAVSKLKSKHVYIVVAAIFLVGLVIAGFGEAALSAIM